MRSPLPEEGQIHPESEVSDVALQADGRSEGARRRSRMVAEELLASPHHGHRPPVKFWVRFLSISLLPAVLLAVNIAVMLLSLPRVAEHVACGCICECPGGAEDVSCLNSLYNGTACRVEAAVCATASPDDALMSCSSSVLFHIRQVGYDFTLVLQTVPGLGAQTALVYLGYLPWVLVWGKDHPWSRHMLRWAFAVALAYKAVETSVYADMWFGLPKSYPIRSPQNEPNNTHTDTLSGQHVDIPAPSPLPPLPPATRQLPYRRGKGACLVVLFCLKHHMLSEASVEH
jgi:hypothetical protein